VYAARGFQATRTSSGLCHVSPDDFYLPLLQHENIEHRFLGGHDRVAWAMRVRRFLRTYRQDVVLAFLQTATSEDMLDAVE